MAGRVIVGGSERAEGNGSASGGYDPTEWVVVLCGQGAVIGRLSGSTERDVRAEMVAGKTPRVTLLPAYLVMSQAMFGQDELGRIRLAGYAHTRDALESALDLGRRASAPLHVTLSAFYFVGDFDPQSRRHVMTSVEDAEKRRRAVESGIVSVP